MPCYNEATTIDDGGRARCSTSPYTARADHRRRRLDRRHAARSSPRSTTRGSGCCCSRMNQGKGAALRRGFAEARSAVRHRAGRRPRVRPGRVPRAARSRSSRARPTSSSARGSSAADPHRVLYFWHSVGNRFADHGVEHVHQPEPDRHGDLLQGLPPRGAPEHHARGEPLRLRAGDHGQGRRRPLAGLRGRHLLQAAAPTKRARRSAGATASGRSTASSATRRPDRSCASAASVAPWTRSPLGVPDPRSQRHDVEAERQGDGDLRRVERDEPGGWRQQRG